MDAKSKRIFQREMNRIFRLFSVEFEYQMPSKPEHKKIPDFIPNNENENHFHKITEPLIPVGTSASSTIGNQTQMIPGGVAETYSHEWISKVDIPIKTLVKYQNKKLYVNKRASYEDVAGIFIYFLSGRSDLNDISS